MVLNHGLHPLRTMVLKSPSATTSMFFSIARCQGGDFQDHGSEVVQTMVQDHGFARVGTMQVQAIMPPLNWSEKFQDFRPGFNSQARMKPSIENEIFKRATQQGPWLWGLLKVEIETFK